jgi:ATP-dependent Clp protease ATP-binding subunit ClpC
VIKHISEEGYDEKYGARPLQRAIQTILEDLISEEILKGTVTEGNSYFVNYNKKTNKVKIKQK